MHSNKMERKVKSMKVAANRRKINQVTKEYTIVRSILLFDGKRSLKYLSDNLKSSSKAYSIKT